MSTKQPPTDDDILAAVRKWGNRSMTYVVRNRLAGDFPHQDIKTTWMLRQLKRLERDGKVRRVNISYLVQYCWSAI